MVSYVHARVWGEAGPLVGQQGQWRGCERETKEWLACSGRMVAARDLIKDQGLV
jgi:hypothetical protein